MTTLGLKYGRLDFLKDENNRWWFLEVNANGQFAWLDLDGSRGLLDAVFAMAAKAPEGF
jgi:hypothetical protein